MQHPFTIIIIICLVLFSIFRRVRRNIGWQKLNQKPMMIRTAIFFVIGLLFLAASGFHPISMLSDAVGILLGVLLAYYAAVMTRYEQRNGRWHFRPNTWIGSVVTALFFVRLIYRFYVVYSVTNQGGFQHGQSSANGFQSLSLSGSTLWTSGLLLIMFAYYATYNILVLRKQKRLSQSNNHVQL